MPNRTDNPTTRSTTMRYTPPAIQQVVRAVSLIQGSGKPIGLMADNDVREQTPGAYEADE